jgi:hypothetical protein
MRPGHDGFGGISNLHPGNNLGRGWTKADRRRIGQAGTQSDERIVRRRHPRANRWQQREDGDDGKDGDQKLISRRSCCKQARGMTSKQNGATDDLLREPEIWLDKRHVVRGRPNQPWSLAGPNLHAPAVARGMRRLRRIECAVGREPAGFCDSWTARHRATRCGCPRRRCCVI